MMQLHDIVSPMQEGRWAPILEGDAAARAIEVTRAIADSLATRTIEPDDAAHAALFWAYAAGEWNDAETDQRYAIAVERLTERIAGEHVRDQLFGGLAGDGWVLAHVATDDAGEILDLVDGAVIEALAESPWTRPYDLGEGLVGFGVYFLERLENAPSCEMARDGLEQIASHLEALRVREPAIWHTPNAHVPPRLQRGVPRGYRDCGVAHGIAGVIALLGKLASLPEPISRAKDMLGPAMHWLWGQQLDDPKNRFPAWVARDVDPKPTRTAWCYGDPGVAIALWSAASRTGGSIDGPRTLARTVATRPAELTGVVDAGLCHGAAGLGHLLARCYHASGDTALRDGAIAWFERALAMPQLEVAGLLEGKIGVGLALLGAISATEPAWDRLLLCDLPEVSR
jgi:hypothetical protein